MNTTVGTNINSANPGYGTQITGAGGNSGGFDVTQSNAPSLYNTTNGVTPTYTAVTSTAGTLNALTGYFLYIRGDRSMDMTLPLATGMPTSSTTLRATGTLVTGTLSVFSNALSTGDGIMNLVTNPYASPIDWSAIYNDGGANPNLYNYYTYWDANIGTRGGFVTVTDGGTVNPTPSGGIPAATTIIQPGQAFFVTSQGSSQPTLSIKESHKTSGNNNGVFRLTTVTESFSTKLYFTEPNGYRRIADGVIAIYDNSYSTGLDGNDALEINNWDENIAISRLGKHLAIESRPVIQTTDTIPLFMNNMKQQGYEFEFTPSTFTNTGLKAELIDNFLGTRSLLSVTTTTVVPFTITTDPASSATDRFMVVFGPFAPLAIDQLSINAYQKNAGALVEWTAKTETDMDHYEVERSFDGTQFSKQTTVAAIGNSNVAVNYNWFDASPQTGYNFYRIKAVDKSGQTKYTSVVKVLIGKSDASVSVYPNPLNGKTIGLQLWNMDKGTYTVSLYNSMGQKVFSTPVQHSGGSATKTIELGNALPGGVYQLSVTGENNLKLTSRIIKN
jgi:hypothetical protein